MRAVMVILWCALLLGGAGCGKDPVVGRWTGENGRSIAVSEDGTVIPEGHSDLIETCRTAGFTEAADQCSAGHWQKDEASDGYLIGLPVLDIGTTTPDQGGEEEVVMCRCQGSTLFAAQVDGDSMVIDMSQVGGPVMTLRRD